MSKGDFYRALALPFFKEKKGMLTVKHPLSIFREFIQNLIQNKFFNGKMGLVCHFHQVKTF
jgi:hypothetical protein